MTKSVIKTKYQKEKEARELSIYTEWNDLMKQPGAMATAVDEHLMKKHNIHSRSSIWTARKRAEKAITERELLNQTN